MEILRTKVFPKADRNVALAILQADLLRGKHLLFSLADKKGGAISGCKRLSKALSSECQPVHKSGLPSISNYSNGYIPLNESDIEQIVKGLGTRFPCQHGWIMSVQNLELFLKFFNAKSDAVNQNSFLPGACNVFCFGVFGVIGLSVNAITVKDAISEIASDDPLKPFGGKSWAYMHFALDDKDCQKAANMKRLRGAELKKHLKLLDKSVKSARTDGRKSSGSEPRVSLSSIAKKHFKKLGYVWNKTESEPRVTVFDKVTELGNVIRINVDAGGFNDVIPYVDARFLSAGFESESVWVVAAQSVATADELQSLLSKHEKDLRYFEQHIATIYDQEMGRSEPTITTLIQEHRIRRIE